MPRCEGLPGGPCPEGRKDSTVRSTQGDLFLCRACEEFRFPAPQKHATCETRSKSKNKCNADDKPSVAVSHIKCDICLQTFDQQRSAMQQEVFSILLTIVHETGWVCHSCRNSCKSQLEKLHTKQSVVTDEIAKIRTSMHKLSNKVSEIESLAQSDPASSETTDMNIKSCIVKTVQEINRRDSNVVVAGFPEQEHKTDDEAFLSFCESNLAVKPVIVWCRRLGKNSSALTDSNSSASIQPRRLLVRLRSPQAASDLRYASRELKHSSDASVRQIYINPDLTREQAKLAFEERQKRRERGQQLATNSNPLPAGQQQSSDGSSSSSHQPSTSDHVLLTGQQQ